MLRKNNLGNEVTATVSWTFNFEILDNTASQDFCVSSKNAVTTSSPEFVSIFYTDLFSYKSGRVSPSLGELPESHCIQAVPTSD